MDKRYLLILVITLVCCINLSIIVNNSDIIGSASGTAGKYTFSLPQGFSLHSNMDNSAEIRNNNGMNIYLESNLTDSDKYDNRLNFIENDSNSQILSKGTINIENISVHTVYFQTANNTNKSVFYFEKFNTPFKIVISSFNYENDRDLTLNYVTLIIKSIRLDYKQE